MIFLLTATKLIFLIIKVYVLLINCKEFFGDFTLINFVNNFDYEFVVIIFNFIQLIVLVDYNFVSYSSIISILNFVDDVAIEIGIMMENFAHLLVNLLI